MPIPNIPPGFTVTDIKNELGSSTNSLVALGGEANPPLTVPFLMSDFAGYTNTLYGYYHNDGVNDYGQITGGAGSNAFGSGRLSISFWVRQNAPTHHNAQMLNFAPGFDKNNRIMIDYNTNNSKLRFNHRQGGQNNLREYYMGSNAPVGTGGNWTSGNRGNTAANGWTLITVVYDGGRPGLDGLTFYWNANPLDFQATSINGARADLAATNLRIGENIHSVGSAGNANMDFDQIRGYARLLNQGEVTQIFNNGPTGPDLGGEFMNIKFDNSQFIDEGGHFGNSGTMVNGGHIQDH